MDIVSGQSTTYGTASTLGYWYSTNATSYGAGYTDANLPTTEQTLLAGATSATISIKGISGSLSLSGNNSFAGLTSTANATTYALTLTPTLTKAGYTFSAGNK